MSLINLGLDPGLEPGPPLHPENLFGERAAQAMAVNDRQSPTVGPGKDFQKKITDYCAQMAVTQKRKEIV